jgi:hypothetical protein
LRLPPDVIAATASRRLKTGRTAQHLLRTSLNIVARQPRFAHDAVKAAPHSDG